MGDADLALDLGRLIARTEINVGTELDQHRSLARLITDIAAHDSKPLLALGILVEGIVHMLKTAVPPKQRAEVADRVSVLLANRLMSQGLAAKEDSNPSEQVCIVPKR